jgi:small-conductance mechanosensitive channel
MARAQQADSAVQPLSHFVEKVKRLAADENSENLRLYREGKISITRGKTIENIKSLSQLIKLYMKNGLDTVEIENDLETTRQSLNLAKDGIITNKGTIQTQRNLYVTAMILSELLDRTSNEKTALDNYTHNLILYKDKMDSLTSDSSLYKFPSDSLSILKYVQRLEVVNKEIRPVDSSLRAGVFIAQELQLRMDLMVFDLRSLSEDIELYRTKVSYGVFNRELPGIFAPAGSNRPIKDLIQFSRAKEKMELGFYLQGHQDLVLIILILIGGATYFTRSVKKLMKQEKLLEPNDKGQLVLKYPFLSSVFIVLNLFQFIFISPPFIFSFCIASISIVCLTIIAGSSLTRYWLRFWIVAILFFLMTSADNFVLQASRPERWFMTFLHISGIALIIYLFSKGRLKQLNERGIVYFIVFVIFVETISLFLNLNGRFNLSKSLLVAGYVGLVIAVLFFWTIRLINQMLGITFRIYKVPDRRMFYINFDKVGNKIPGIFYVILVLGWFIILGRNFYAFKLITDPIQNFVTRSRTVGVFSFSVSGILIFLLILILSAVLSKLISFFASVPSPGGTGKGNQTGVGSWLLLVRIFILSLGVILAFAATGIPIDRLTIILGALSVGIGLGLQSIVTNLVSGLIIAFEKPINVGDFLEVNGKMATMKSIGFRSSVVRLVDGAHVVIPNADVLNQHLVNWSMGRNIKRISIAVGVAYGTDLEKAKSLLSNILSEDERILKFPSPVVFARKFGASSVDYELFFWAGHVFEVDSIQSEVLIKIDKAFRAAGITIPFPQTDLNIRNLNNEKKTD